MVQKYTSSFQTVVGLLIKIQYDPHKSQKSLAPSKYAPPELITYSSYVFVFTRLPCRILKTFGLVDVFFSFISTADLNRRAFKLTIHFGNRKISDG
jgi:hypothetical protein